MDSPKTDSAPSLSRYSSSDSAAAFSSCAAGMSSAGESCTTTAACSSPSSFTAEAPVCICASVCACTCFSALSVSSSTGSKASSVSTGSSSAAGRPSYSINSTPTQSQRFVPFLWKQNFICCLSSMQATVKTAIQPILALNCELIFTLIFLVSAKNLLCPKITSVVLILSAPALYLFPSISNASKSIILIRQLSSEVRRNSKINALLSFPFTSLSNTT